MKAKKSNKSYNIEPREVNSFKSQGYDIYDDDGVLVEYGAGKTISANKYLELVKENKKLKEQIDALAQKLENKKSNKEK